MFTAEFLNSEKNAVLKSNYAIKLHSSITLSYKIFIAKNLAMFLGALHYDINFIGQDRLKMV